MPKKTNVAALMDAEEESPLPDLAPLEVAPAANDVGVPKTKAAVNKMTLTEMEELYTAQDYDIPKWDNLTIADKKEALILHLGLAKAPKPKAISDPIMVVANEIEQLSTQTAVETEIDSLIKTEGLNDFRLGGLLIKLQEVGQFSETMTFKDYVSERFGVEYGKARYLIRNYNGLLNAEISWESASAVGWTKLNIILPVLTKENAAEWIEKALANNKVTLQEMVKAALTPDEVKAGVEETKNYKTKTFKVAEDQETVIDEALADAGKKSGSNHPGVQLEYVCVEYLAADGSKPGANAKELKDLKRQVEELQEKLSNAEAQLDAGGSPSPRQIFKAVKDTSGSVSEALSILFGDDSGFADVFPGVDLEFNVPEED